MIDDNEFHFKISMRLRWATQAHLRKLNSCKKMVSNLSGSKWEEEKFWIIVKPTTLCNSLISGKFQWNFWYIQMLSNRLFRILASELLCDSLTICPLIKVRHPFLCKKWSTIAIAHQRTSVAYFYEGYTLHDDARMMKWNRKLLMWILPIFWYKDHSLLVVRVEYAYVLGMCTSVLDMGLGEKWSTKTFIIITKIFATECAQ